MLSLLAPGEVGHVCSASVTVSGRLKHMAGKAGLGVRSPNIQSEVPSNYCRGEEVGLVYK